MAREIKLADRYLFNGLTYEVKSIVRGKIILQDINEHRPHKGFIQRTPEQIMAARFMGSGS